MKTVIKTALLLILALSSCTSLIPAERKLRIAALQTSIYKSVYISEAGFIAWAENLISKAETKYNPDLIVFPEYTGAMFVLFSYPDELAASGSLDDFISAVRRNEDDGMLTLRRLFFEHDCTAVMDRIWGRLAAGHGVYILGGSYFAPEGTKLYNRAAVYAPDGSRFYSQDKVFIAPMEKEYFRLTPGKMSDAMPFEINGYRLALTICRDTYYSDWEKRFSESDVWINIKANNEPFRADTGSYFTWSLVNRTRAAGVQYGISACLTGELFGMKLEGKSVVINNGKAVFAGSEFGEEILGLEVR